MYALVSEYELADGIFLYFMEQTPQKKKKQLAFKECSN